MRLSVESLEEGDGTDGFGVSSLDGACLRVGVGLRVISEASIMELGSQGSWVPLWDLGGLGTISAEHWLEQTL